MDSGIKIPTFEEQSQFWLHELQFRKRSPAKISSIAQFKSHIAWLVPQIGAVPLSEITNRLLKELVPKITGSPKTIQCYLSTVKAVVASALDEDGQPQYPRKWNSDFIDVPNVIDQKTPMFSSEQIADMLKIAGTGSLLYKTAAGSGLRIGELLALEPRHFKRRTVKVEQSLWGNLIQTPKTQNGYREVDLPTCLAEELQENLRGRETGFIFEEPHTYGGVLTKLHDVLEKAHIDRSGFHAFRRFRKTHLGKSHVPRDLIKYWLGHADSDVTDSYDKIEQDVEFRLAEAERAGLGF
jgi:integrase